MSHSTNSGASGPPISAFNDREFRSYCDSPPLFDASWVVGVGYRREVVEFPYFTASVRLTPACALLPGRFRLPELLASPAVGVGHKLLLAMVSRLGRPALGRSKAPPIPLIPFCELP